MIGQGVQTKPEVHNVWQLRQRMTERVFTGSILTIHQRRLEAKLFALIYNCQDIILTKLEVTSDFAAKSVPASRCQEVGNGVSLKKSGGRAFPRVPP